MSTAAARPVYQLKVTIKHVRPPIWRRLQVSGGASLAELHDVLQIAFGWTDTHLHQFVIGGAYYGVPDPDEVDWPPLQDERRMRLGDIAATTKSFVYAYDFGDGWEHSIVVEKTLEPEPGVAYPRCLAGRRNGPPEDCGGPWGYMELLQALADPTHPEHAEMREWLGGELDPDALDLGEVNALLRPDKR